MDTPCRGRPRSCSPLSVGRFAAPGSWLYQGVRPMLICSQSTLSQVTCGTRAPLSAALHGRALLPRPAAYDPKQDTGGQRAAAPPKAPSRDAGLLKVPGARAHVRPRGAVRPPVSPPLAFHVHQMKLVMFRSWKYLAAPAQLLSISAASLVTDTVLEIPCSTRTAGQALCLIPLTDWAEPNCAK